MPFVISIEDFFYHTVELKPIKAFDFREYGEPFLVYFLKLQVKANQELLTRGPIRWIKMNDLWDTKKMDFKFDGPLTLELQSLLSRHPEIKGMVEEIMYPRRNRVASYSRPNLCGPCLFCDSLEL